MNLNEKNPKPGTHVEESVKDLKARVDKHPIDFNKLLPTDINSDIYDISKAKEYQDVVEEYYPIETIVYGIKNNRPDFIEKGRKEIYIRTNKNE